METNKILRRISLIGIFLIPFIPLIVSYGSFFPFITGKNFAFRVLVEIVFACWLILALRSEVFRPKKHLLVWILSAFLVVMFIADALSLNAYKSFWSNFERMEGFVTLAHLMAYFLVLGSVLNTQKLWTRFFQTIVGVSAIVSIYSFFQLVGVFAIHQGAQRLDATLGNATYLAVYLLFTAFLTVLLWLKDQNGTGMKVTYGAILFLQLFSLYNTATRGALLGLIGGVLVTLAYLAIFEKVHLKLKKFAVWSLLAVIIAVIGFALLRNSQFLQNKGPISRLANISLSEGAPRFQIWNMAWQGFKEKPIFGWGQESFNYVFNKYYSPEMYAQEQWFDRAHNVFLDWLISGGILGFLGYLCLYLMAIYLVWHNSDSRRLSVSEKAVLIGLIVAYGINNIFVFDQLVSYLMFFSLLSYLYAKETSTLSDNGVNLNLKYHFEQGLTDRIFIPAIVVLAILFIYSTNFRSLMQSRTLSQAVQQQSGGPTKTLELFKEAVAYNSFGLAEVRELLAQNAYALARTNAPIEVKKEFFDFTKEELLKQVEKTPQDARYQLFMGNFLDNFQMYDDALKYLNKALELSPKKQTILFEIGSIYLARGDYNQALTILKKAVDLEPNFLEAKKIYALGAIYAKKIDLAKELLLPIYGSILIPDDRFVNAFAAIGDFDSVAKIWQLKIADSPNDPSPRLSLAATYLKLGQRQAAVAEIQKAIEINPSIKDQGEYYIREIQAGRNP